MLPYPTLAEAAKNVVPVAKMSAEAITQLRMWATNRVLDASQNGIYTMTSTPPSTQRRRVVRAG